MPADTWCIIHARKETIIVILIIMVLMHKLWLWSLWLQPPADETKVSYVPLRLRCQAQARPANVKRCVDSFKNKRKFC